MSGAAGKERDSMEQCVFEGCDRPKKIKKSGLCNTHAAQKQAGKNLTPIGSTWGGKSKRKGFAETRVCHICKEEKNWKAFVLGADNIEDCRECYRKRLLKPEETVSTFDVDEVLGWIDRSIEKSRRKQKSTAA